MCLSTFTPWPCRREGSAGGTWPSSGCCHPRWSVFAEMLSHQIHLGGLGPQEAEAQTICRNLVGAPGAGTSTQSSFCGRQTGPHTHLLQPRWKHPCHLSSDLSPQQLYLGLLDTRAGPAQKPAPATSIVKGPPGSQLLKTLHWRCLPNPPRAPGPPVHTCVQSDSTGLEAGGWRLEEAATSWLHAQSPGVLPVLGPPAKPLGPRPHPGQS